MATSPNFYSGADIWIGSTPFNTQDANGCRWLITDLDGWWGLPEPEVPDEARAYTEDGSYYAAGRYTARTVSVSGAIVPPDTTFAGRKVASSARDTLSRAMIPMIRGTRLLRVDESDNSKIAEMQLVSRPIYVQNAQNGTVTFNFDLRATDMRKYALDLTTSVTTVPTGIVGRTYSRVYDYYFGGSSSSGRITVENLGNYSTYGTLRITGPIADPAVEQIETGRILRFDVTLGEFDYIDVDLKLRTIVLNGTENRHGILAPSSTWFDIPAGTSTLRFTGTEIIPDLEDEDLATMTLSYRSAWVE